MTRTLTATYGNQTFSLANFENMVLEKLGLDHPIYKKDHFIQPMTYLELCTNLQHPRDAENKESIVREWLETALLQPGWSDSPEEAAEFIYNLERRVADFREKPFLAERVYTFIECVDAFSEIFNETDWTFR